MGKTEKYAVRGLTIGALLNGTLNVIEQRKRIREIPGTVFSWSELFGEAGKGALTGGLIGGGIGIVRDYQNSVEAPINTDAVLSDLLIKLKLDSSNEDYRQLRQKAEIIIELIQRRFHGLLKREPMFMGSTERGTALSRKFDLDIGLQFFHDSFYSTADMYAAVYDYTRSLSGRYGIVEVRAQKKSVGIICRVQNKELKIDLVPCKATKGKARSNEGYLHVNKNSFWRDDSTYTKTNLQLLNSRRLLAAQKNLVILLKEWVYKKQVPFKSNLLENLVLDAYKYNRGRIPRKLTEKLVMVFEYIADNIEGAYMRSIENTNNIVTNIPYSDKMAIMKACRTAVEEYEYQQNSIVSTIRD